MATKKPAKPKSPRVVVEVRGGLVVAIYANADLDYDVMDWDNAAEDDEERERCKALEDEIEQGGFEDLTAIH